jgi:hypothetical protein
MDRAMDANEESRDRNKGKTYGSAAVALGSYGMSDRERQRRRETWLLLWQIIQHLL